MIYWELFLSFVKVGALSFGGGYAALPLIQEEIVQNRAWLSPAEFSDLITISQMTPGPIAINSASFVGMKMAGVLGGFLATLGSITVPCLVVFSLAYIYRKYQEFHFMQDLLSGIKPVVVALIANAAIDMVLAACWPEGNLNPLNVVLFNLALLILAFQNAISTWLDKLSQKRLKIIISPIHVMALCGLISLVVAILTKKV